MRVRGSILANAFNELVPMRSARATHSTRTRNTTAGRRLLLPAIAARAGGKDGEAFCKFCRAAMRAFRTFPITGPHQDFAISLALLAMKFVNRHGYNLNGWPEISSPNSVQSRHESFREVEVRM